MPSNERLADIVSWIHTAMIPYCLLGWVVPHAPWLRWHATFVPLMVAHWWLNRNVCVLSNLESYLRYGQWWRAQDEGQGQWVQTQIRAVTGWDPPPGFADMATYVALAASTLASLVHLWWLS